MSGDIPEIFWEALRSVERDAFRAVATTRTFAAGAWLIMEGDAAHYVIVILSGRTKICVFRNGSEYVIAERGPGQLVGERAVFELSERTASVIAVESVHALVVRDTDFVSFLDAHPRANAIVRAQLNDRYIEDPPWSAPDGRDGSFDAGATPRGRASSASFSSAGPATPRPQAWNGENWSTTAVMTFPHGSGYG